MVRLGRPERPSYRTCQLIYKRLLKGPLWLEEWKSTGINSRGTVHNALKYFLAKGLIKRRREGHKKLYEIVLKSKNLIEFLSKVGGSDIADDAWSWYQHLHRITRKEKRQMKRRIRKKLAESRLFENEVQEVLGLFNDSFEIEERILNLPKSKEAFKALEKAGIDWKKLPIFELIRDLLSPYLTGNLCKECLSEGIGVFLISDRKTGELICPKCGVVIEIWKLENT